ncbi:hypothetical protein M2454_002985 [Aequitasia blattaphilus]|uniref:Phage protein n=1 Tax=Aequitasia blattaphilus TaxID=2949332 RepID=A0ABT1ED94_9FIRM|nr:hypothetical protein [Aequitasia blattaphilus]MCP1103631.1 hypothetical protein [Aequitasia blattaphilus]MCR8616271.1 hypothetical protein [Aequitasia blattaphilus]
MTKREQAELIVETIDEKVSLVPSYMWDRTVNAVISALMEIEIVEE